MKTATGDLNTLKAEAEKIITSGTDIRPQLAETVAQTAGQSQQSGQSLVALVQAVLDGVRQGFDRSVPDDPDDALRQVVDSLGDGLSRVALAGRLAVEETGGACRQFAREDLIRLRDELKAVESLFGETVARALAGCKGLTATQVNNAVNHARRVAERMGPVFSPVFDAVRRHPILLAKEGLQAGIQAGQGAAGALFQSLGRLLQQAGDELAQKRVDRDD